MSSNWNNFLKKLFRYFLILSGVFFLFIFVLDSFIMPSVVQKNSIAKVPNVIGLKEDEAIEKLKKSQLEAVRSDFRIDNRFPVGAVISQNPNPNIEVKTGRRVYLLISGGEQFVETPSLIGKTFRDAKFILQRFGLKIGEVLHDTSLNFPKGTVKSQNIFPSTKIQKGSFVNIVLSFGEESSNILTPNLVGLKITEAEKIIVNSGFTIGKLNYVPSEMEKPNIIVDQFPRSSEPIILNQPIDLFIATEPNKKLNIEN